VTKHARQKTGCQRNRHTRKETCGGEIPRTSRCVFCASNEALGAGVLMARQPGTVEIGYWLIPRARGRGWGSRAVGLLARWAVTEAPLVRAEALVCRATSPRSASWRRRASGAKDTLRSYLVFERQRADALIYSLLPSDLS
jgi:hypothetical protein